MRVLYIGDRGGTSRHRRNALERLGYSVDLVDPRDIVGTSRYSEKWIWKTGGLGFGTIVRRSVLRHTAGKRYDLCFVNQGELISRELVQDLRLISGAVVNYMCDNPFVERDGRRWRMFLDAVPQYDLFVAKTMPLVHEAGRRGARAIQRFLAADEIVHRPRPETAADAGAFRSDVAFVGTWMPERGPMVVRLLDAGINVRIFGVHWNKAPEYERLKHAIAMPHMLDDEEYVRAVQYAKIALGFLSVGNRDEHTSRSLEIPAIGALLCAQRTSEHLAMYREGEEAIFWDDMDECASQCRALLADPARLAAVAAAGAERQKRSRNWNEPLMQSIAEEALSAPSSRAMG
ncbi:MAG: CgeB family protein [Pseudomonadota bacterium]